MRNAPAFYFVHHTSLQREKCSWKREYFELRADGSLASITEYEDKVFLRLSYTGPWLPSGTQVSTRQAYRNTVARSLVAERERLRKLREGKQAGQLLRGGMARHEHASREAGATGAAEGSTAQPLGLLDDITVLDLEFQGNDLLELAAIRYRHWQPVGQYVSFVRFTGPIRAQVAEMTGIKARDVAHAPEELSVLQHFKALAENSVLVCHNIAADRRVLEAARNRQGATAPLPNAWLCTLALVRLRYPQLASHKLGDVYRHLLGLQPDGAHRALRDVEMCAAVLRHVHELQPLTELVTTASQKKKSTPTQGQLLLA